jgi:hypothetical protein
VLKVFRVRLEQAVQVEQVVLLEQADLVV